MTEKDFAHYDAQLKQLSCRGNWDVNHLTRIEKSLSKISWPTQGVLTINGKELKKLDSAGAWYLLQLQKKLEKKRVKVNWEGFTEEQQKLLSLIQEDTKKEVIPPEPKEMPWLAKIGKNSIFKINELNVFLSFVGKLTFEWLRILPNPAHWRVPSVVNVIYRNGYQALPIIALLSFMIGVVITYQMGLQLKNYGANIYIVDLLGLSVLREFGPLLTAIMVAGRTGSAFTAQLGIMKINQEIDALDTTGVTPAELLLLPRIIGLVVVLPLLTMWANIFGVIGGMVMANNLLDITWVEFLRRFPDVIPLRNLFIGLGKAPVFALIIASIGCFQGMQVRGSADSVGINTTRSVVLSIFFIIVADAVFSVIFSELKL